MKKMFVWALGSTLFFGCNNEKAAETKTEAPPAASTETAPAPAEFADARYSEIGKKGLASLTAGDVDAWMESFADNAVYVWNSGDSLAGKPAISAYWKKRRNEVIDSISFSNQIFLPIKVNQPQSVESPGNWLLMWYQVKTKYKNGKSMGQWIHTDLHFNEADKIDRMIQYIDMAPVKAALAK